MKEKNCQSPAVNYQSIYSLLGSCTPIDGDCGKLCSAACCSIDGKFDESLRDEDYVIEETEGEDELGIYLLPGEETVHDKSDPWLEWTEEDAQSAGFPESWKGKVSFVKCHGPASCKRELRPIQCRTFPAAPYLSKDGNLQIILYTDTLPYKCPLVHGNHRLNEDFLRATFSAWSELIKDPRIFDLVMEDSRFRDECGNRFVKLYEPD